MCFQAWDWTYHKCQRRILPLISSPLKRAASVKTNSAVTYHLLATSVSFAMSLKELQRYYVLLGRETKTFPHCFRTKVGSSHTTLTSNKLSSMTSQYRPLRCLRKCWRPNSTFFHEWLETINRNLEFCNFMCVHSDYAYLNPSVDYLTTNLNGTPL